MNREVMADELDRQIEGMLSGKRTIGADSDPLLAVAAELPMLPDREFRESLKQILVEADAHSFSAEFGNAHPTKSALGGAPSSVVAHASNGKSEWHQPTSLGALTPLFGSKHTGLFPADQRSFLVSFASHAALIALIASGIFVGNVTIVKRTFLTSEITFPAAGHGGGG